MWLEVKAAFSVGAFICIAIVLAFIIFVDLFLSFLLFAALFLVLMGDMMIGWKITKYHLKPLMDPLPAERELCILHTIGGLVDFVVTKKGPLGKREFNYHSREDGRKREASVINDGSYPIRTINGNHGFVAHESYDRNVNLYKAKALERLNGADIKEIYNKYIMEMEKQKNE